MAEIIELTPPGEEEETPTPEQPGIQELGPPAEAGVVTDIDKGLASVLEPAGTLITGALAEPIAGLAGIFQTLNPFADPGAGERAVAGTREALTFQPRSEEGKLGLQAVGEFGPVKAFIEALTSSEEFLGEAGFQLGGPAGGAFGASIPTALLEVLGLVSLKKLRLGKADFIKGGKPTPELQKALDEAGVDFDKLPPAAKKELGQLRQGADVSEEARRARFQEEGIPFTKGDISQEFKQLSKEQRLLSMVTKPEVTESLRQLKFQQSEAFIRSVDEVVDGLGGTAESGEILKGALEGRLELLKSEKNALYKEFAETAPEIQALPIIPDTLIDALPDKQTTRRIERLVPGPAGALDDLMIEFGINTDAAKVDAFIKAGNDITPLNVGNFDDFRQGINLIERTDQTGAIKKLSGPVKTALDNEAGLIDDAVRAAGITDEAVLKPLTEARAKVREIKTVFSPESITGKLIKVKKDGVTPLVEASKVVDQVIGPKVPIENLQRTLDTLKKAGPDGRQAIKSLQASVVFKALDDALGAPTRKTGGVETISGNAFDKSLRKFGDERLNLLFADDPATLKRLKGIQQVAKDITPPAATVPRGSAPIILDALNRFGRTPGIAAVVDAVKFIVKAGADERAVARAVDANPSFSKTVKLIKEDLPNLALALGIGSIAETVPKPGLSLELTPVENGATP